MKHIKITSKLRPALAEDAAGDDANGDDNILDQIRDALGKEPKE